MPTPTTWQTESCRRVSKAERGRNAVNNQLRRIAASRSRFARAVRSGDASMNTRTRPGAILLTACFAIVVGAAYAMVMGQVR